jgi:hypothetical protein
VAKVRGCDGHGCKSDRLDAVVARTASAGGAGGGGRAGVFVSVNTNTAYIKIKGLDFGSKGAAKFFASVAGATKGSAIELRLDSETGPLIGTLKVKPTGALDKWETQSRFVKKTRAFTTCI